MKTLTNTGKVGLWLILNMLVLIIMYLIFTNHPWSALLEPVLIFFIWSYGALVTVSFVVVWKYYKHHSPAIRHLLQRDFAISPVPWLLWLLVDIILASFLLYEGWYVTGVIVILTALCELGIMRMLRNTSAS